VEVEGLSNHLPIVLGISKTGSNREIPMNFNQEWWLDAGLARKKGYFWRKSMQEGKTTGRKSSMCKRSRRIVHARKA
jgi:hypothetical protein